jgi:antitoxin (DNA-binding transcriptional repressor) of toxin-antitoxin stability system
MKTLDATEPAESFTTVLGRVVSRREPVEIMKEGVACAYLVPAAQAPCNSHLFADYLTANEFPQADRKEMASALHKGRKSLKRLKNPWD